MATGAGRASVRPVERHGAPRGSARSKSVAPRRPSPSPARPAADHDGNAGSNQGLIMNKGGARLLANVASKTDDPQTLRMVAGAIANLCGNEKLHVTLKQDGGIKALLGMFRTGHNDVIAQIARGIANFAKCESRVISQEENARDIIVTGGIKELLRISRESSREDARNLAKKALNSNPAFLMEIQ